MTRTSEGFASGLAVQNTVDCLFRCVSSSLTNSMRACLSNCGCTYDGGDCFAKTVSGVTVETKFWFVHSSLLDQTVRIRLCCRTVCLLNLCGRDRFLGQAVVFLGQQLVLLCVPCLIRRRYCALRVVMVNARYYTAVPRKSRTFKYGVGSSCGPDIKSYCASCILHIVDFDYNNDMDEYTLDTTQWNTVQQKLISI